MVQNVQVDGDICDKGQKGLFLPLGGDSEQEWPRGLRIFLYGVGLFWCFLGVGLAADIFMGAIEKITSKKTKKFHAGRGRWYTVEVWNPTVANLTLMALGSSAPEILLSVIELFSNEFFSGKLGPSTIVGSAAFNLLVIIAVCVSAIPDGQIRRIKELPVYLITAFFSVFAYLWLLFILMGTSKNVVEPWEGVVTFLFFPLLVCLAYLADKGYFTGSRTNGLMGTPVVLSSDMPKEELAEMDMKIRKQYGEELTPEQVSKIILIENQRRTRATYRVEATRAMTGGKRPKTQDRNSLMKTFTGVLGDKLQNQITATSVRKVVPDEEQGKVKKAATTIEWQVPGYAVLEKAPKIDCFVSRIGELNTKCSVRYATREGTAKAAKDFAHKEGVLEFLPGEDKKTISIEIIDNDEYEDDEDLFIDLFDPKVTSECSDDTIAISEPRFATITIIDDDWPGELFFPQESIQMVEQMEDWELIVPVERKNGCTGRITCKYRTEGDVALPGLDYKEAEGTLVFEASMQSTKITLTLLARGRYSSADYFRLILTDVTGGGKFDKASDGGEDSDICTITIEPQQHAKDRVDQLMSSLASSWDKSKVGHAKWGDQFKNAVLVNGAGDDDGEEESSPPSIFDYVIHVLTMPWKLLFALVPPVDYCGGWVCFCCSLIAIGIVTAIINDMASLFGCVLTLGPEVTAITFVALGTSLPDTFASMKAATEDRYADASIGNVTGSNSVNVFLGLGLPWMIGAIFWRSGTPSAKWVSMYALDTEVPAEFRDGAFVVKAGSLGFSVGIFCGCACTCLGVVSLRRKFCEGELGGPKIPKYMTSAALVFLWCIYIGLSSWKSLST